MLQYLLNNNGTPLSYIMLSCECIIGTFGIISIILGDNLHERLHGIFVLLLAIQGIFDFFFGFESIISKIVLIIVTSFAVFFIFMSLQTEIVRYRMRKILKQKGYSAEVDAAKEEGSKSVDFTNEVETKILESLYEKINDDKFENE